jgi:hypothetical protein
LYSLSEKLVCYSICLRGYNLTKKLNKKQKKSTLVFLRAPKHFNIGKRKVHSFKNYNKIIYKLNLKIPLIFFLKNFSIFFSVLQNFHKFNLLYKIFSIKISLKVKIKFQSDNSYSF